MTEAVLWSCAAYFLSIPIVLCLLRGERPWRLTVAGIWVVYVGLMIWAYLNLH